MNLTSLLSAIARANLGTSALAVLLRVRDMDGNAKMRDATEATGKTSASSTGIVDRLEKLGLLRRVQYPEDRRAIYLETTDSGELKCWELEEEAAKAAQKERIEK